MTILSQLQVKYFNHHTAHLMIHEACCVKISLPKFMYVSNICLTLSQVWYKWWDLESENLSNWEEGNGTEVGLESRSNDQHVEAILI